MHVLQAIASMVKFDIAFTKIQDSYTNYIDSKQGKIVTSIHGLHQHIQRQFSLVDYYYVDTDYRVEEYGSDFGSGDLDYGLLGTVYNYDRNTIVDKMQTSLNDSVHEVMLWTTMLGSLNRSDSPDEMSWPKKERFDQCRPIIDLGGIVQLCDWYPNCLQWNELMSCFYDYYDIAKAVSAEQIAILKDVDIMINTLKSFDTLVAMVEINVSTLFNIFSHTLKNLCIVAAT